jgi:hypothetical protein
VTNSQIARALAALAPGAQWSLNGDSLEGLDWLDEQQERPSNAVIEAKIAEMASPAVALRAYASNRRWEKEVGGIAFNGAAVPTNDRSKLLILGAAMRLADEATSPFIIDGVVLATLTGEQFRALNAAVTAHVQATYAVLADVLADIASEDITTVEEIDALFAA